ncbi:hypothetical protein FT663_02419 [Candidozyma haemuli var. vulneris]|uniref:Protein NRD1 n=1 Tax=Candidozyma haemuli TaxID=45357 RepID=A0A2V1AN97_9ASCO|nr:hypothetical protein CXQ85_001493 [[Candida] haemuloni]KAF3992102.1 hypothetical protein FT663_02419 [[Candida] haemuloni var. vulneris]KAF3992720.1 hypothetical protein FT662_00929 [[Candida] haemuloni var. vulneris]PVH19192.1 hypothetical protein CXQ85_001493 [[Candida] haemuloni]
MSAVSEFESILQELPTIKAPGVSGSRIKKLTDIAVKNVADESQLVSALYNSCKATPSSHKLGALYVVDSIVRVYKEEAKKKGETIDSSAPEGTFASGVFKISELIESIMDDAMSLSVVPATDVKISKLVDIWERAQTFSPATLAAIRDKHFRSTTPPGSPPNKTAPPPPPAVSAPPASAPAGAAAPAKEGDSGSILSALASLAKKTETPTPPAVASPGAQQAPPANNQNAANILSQLSALAGGSQNNGNSPAHQNSNIRSPSYQNAQPAQPSHLPQLPNLPNIPQGQGQGQGQGQQNQQLFSMLQQMQGNQGHSQPPPNSQPPMPNGLPPVPGMPQMPPQGYGGYNDRGGYPQQQQQQQFDRRGREEAGGYSRRNRSRSPPRGHNNGFSPNAPQEKSLSHGFSPYEGERNIPGSPHYRPRNVGFDNSIPQGSFKVMSRTLFIGGVPRGMDERSLASHLRPYAEVQSVILNSERKHAFVKVYSRKEAEAVVQSFNKDGALPLRTRWGVGFGPRDCCNYQHGVSIIPMVRLTDADKQWVVDAEWGGTGGQPLVTGIVIDEPDIEIGTGISSKAMSKKMPTNSTRNGPKSNRPGESEDQYVKTGMGARPDFNGYGNNAANPLSGLFANSPPQGFPGQMPMQQQGAPQQQPPQGFPPNFGNQQNPNLGAQLANFFQNGGQQQQ